MVAKTVTQTKPNIKAFEEAREAVIKLETLSKILTSAELETLEILLDTKSVALLSESVTDARNGKLEPIEKIL